MRAGYKNTIIFLLIATIFAACSQNSGMSVIPNIVLTNFGPDTIYSGVDSIFIQFSILDGDGDIGTTATDTNSSIFFEDSRYDSGYFGNPFPIVDASVELPTKGLQGTCTFTPYPPPVPRPDTIHKKYGDTLFYRIYITDRAKHHSDTIVTPRLIILP